MCQLSKCISSETWTAFFLLEQCQITKYFVFLCEMWESNSDLWLAFLIWLKNKISFVVGFYTALFSRALAEYCYLVIALLCNKHYKFLVLLWRFSKSECSTALTDDLNSQDTAFPTFECNTKFHLVLGLRWFTH